VKVGLLSDTHGYLDPALEKHFAGCDEIWHAGDIGSVDVLTQLRVWKPVRAVYGNIDEPEIRHRLPEDEQFTAEGVHVWITHIGGSPPHYNARVNKRLETDTPHVFICGHSHILKVMKDEKRNGMLFINPGAAGMQGFHPVRTAVRFDIGGGRISRLEVIELGKRG
jgi:hypothetical protein